MYSSLHPTSQQPFLDEDSTRPLTYLFNVPEGAEVEWPIRVLEDDLVRLEPVDVSPLSPFLLTLSVRTSLGQLTVALSRTRMTLYLSTVITQTWNADMERCPTYGPHETQRCVARRCPPLLFFLRRTCLHFEMTRRRGWSSPHLFVRPDQGHRMEWAIVERASGESL